MNLNFFVFWRLLAYECCFAAPFVYIFPYVLIDATVGINQWWQRWINDGVIILFCNNLFHKYTIRRQNCSCEGLLMSFRTENKVLSCASQHLNLSTVETWMRMRHKKLMNIRDLTSYMRRKISRSKSSVVLILIIFNLHIHQFIFLFSPCSLRIKKRTASVISCETSWN